MDEYEAKKYRKTLKKGIKIGEANGIKIGEANGIKIGEANGLRNTALRMMQSGLLSDAQILEITGLTKEQLQQIRQENAQGCSI